MLKVDVLPIMAEMGYKWNEKVSVWLKISSL